MPSVPKAVDLNGVEFTAADCARLGDRFAETYPPIRPTQGYECADEDCRADVVYVTGYARRPAQGQRGRRAHLRLRKGQVHAAGCSYSFDGLAAEIVEIYADEVERNGDHFVLVLRPPVDERGQPAPARQEDPPPAQQQLDVRTRVNSPRLCRTIQAAAHVIELLNHFDTEPERVNRFRATWSGTTIRWQDFFFDLTTDGGADRLARYLGRRRGDHPIAVLSYVAFAADESKGGDSWALRISEPGEAVVRIRTDRADDVDYEPGALLLAYGDWKNWKAKPEHRGEVQMWIDDRNGGIAEISD